VIEHEGRRHPVLRADRREVHERRKYRRDLPEEIVKALVIPASANLSRAEATSSRPS
jgi:hypothetical protein